MGPLSFPDPGVDGSPRKRGCGRRSDVVTFGVPGGHGERPRFVPQSTPSVALSVAVAPCGHNEILQGLLKNREISQHGNIDSPKQGWVRYITTKTTVVQLWVNRGGHLTVYRSGQMRRTTYPRYADESHVAVVKSFFSLDDSHRSTISLFIY